MLRWISRFRSSANTRLINIWIKMIFDIISFPRDTYKMIIQRYHILFLNYRHILKLLYQRYNNLTYVSFLLFIISMWSNYIEYCKHINYSSSYFSSVLCPKTICSLGPNVWCPDQLFIGQKRPKYVTAQIHNTKFLGLVTAHLAHTSSSSNFWRKLKTTAFLFRRWEDLCFLLYWVIAEKIKGKTLYFKYSIFC